MAENKLADMSTAFAVRILKLTESVKGHYSLCNQLERSGTSIGANIREAKYAHSKRILSQNCKSPSKNVTKQNIGSRLGKKLRSLRRKRQVAFFMTVALFAVC